MQGPAYLYLEIKMGMVSHENFHLHVVIPLINDLRALLDPAAVITAAARE